MTVPPAISTQACDAKCERYLTVECAISSKSSPRLARMPLFKLHAHGEGASSARWGITRRAAVTALAKLVQAGEKCVEYCHPWPSVSQHREHSETPSNLWQDERTLRHATKSHDYAIEACFSMTVQLLGALEPF